MAVQLQGKFDANAGRLERTAKKLLRVIYLIFDNIYICVNMHLGTTRQKHLLTR